MPNKRLVLLLALMVLAPLGVLGWFAHHSLAGRNAELRAQFQALLQERNDQAAQGINATVQGLALGMNSALDRIQSPAELATASQREPLAAMAFWLDSSAHLSYPDSTRNLSRTERDFLVRTRSLWNGSARLDLSGGAEVPAIQTPSSRTPNATIDGGLLALARQEEHGWIPWFWEDGLHLLYWKRANSGAVMGFEVDRTALLAWIIGALPEKDPGHGCFVLRDENGSLLHRYGGYRVSPEDTPLAQQKLAMPLQGWTLAYYGPSDAWETAFTRSERSAQLMRYSILGLLLLGIALWFWRESTRSLREARERVDFVNQVSHELKTPLTNIRLYAELLEDDLEDEQQRQKLQIIRSESERLSRMILNILTFSRREKRKLQLNRQPLNLEESVQAVVTHFALSMEKRGLRAIVKGHAERPVSLDPDATGQIIANLLSNAEKYAAAGKEVIVELRQTPTCTELEVRDHGPGIPWKLREQVFQPFYRISDHLTEGVAGTGIGLDIARTLARLMGGTLELAPSESGARFVWRIPA